MSAYASVTVSDAFTEWQSSLESFEVKLDEFSFVAQEAGDQSVPVEEAEPHRDAEVAARKRLADAVNAQLV